jgi:cobaltochelatase CobN
MHLLVTTPGEISDGTEAVDLNQSPGDIVVLSAAASDLSALSAARSRLQKYGPSLRFANLLQLGHNMSVDLYLEKTVTEAKLVVVRLLGGVGYWPYGVEQLNILAAKKIFTSPSCRVMISPIPS